MSEPAELHEVAPGVRLVAPEDASLIRLALPDRPGALALVSSRIAARSVNILRLEVVAREDGTAIDDLLVAGGDLAGAVASLEPDVRLLACREHGELPDPGLAMAAACASVTGAAGAGEARRRLLDAALKLGIADDGLILRDAGHGWLRPVASTVEHLPPIRAHEPSVARAAVGSGRPVVARGEEQWAPPVYRSRFGAGHVLAVPGGVPPFFALTVIRRDEFLFVEAEITRLQALVRVAVGTLAAFGERAVQAPERPAVQLRLGSHR